MVAHGSAEAPPTTLNSVDISPRTVEVHRGRLMDKMQARNLSDLVRMALAAGIGAAKPVPKPL